MGNLALLTIVSRNCNIFIFIICEGSSTSNASYVLNWFLGSTGWDHSTIIQHGQPSSCLHISTLGKTLIQEIYRERISQLVSNVWKNN